MARSKVCLLVIVLAGMSSVVSAQRPKKTLPLAQTLIEKHLQATGGKKKHLALRSQHFESTVDTTAGRDLKGKMEIHFARIRVKDEKSGKLVDRPSFRFHMQLGAELTTIASNGVVAWQATTSIHGKHNLFLLSKAQLATYLNIFDPSGFARYETTFKSWKTLGKTMINGSPAYEVEMVAKDGSAEHYFFSLKSGLLVGMKSFLESPSGVQVSKTSISDYRDAGGILTAFKTYQEGPGFKQGTVTLPGGGYNVKIDPEVFKPTAEVLALAKKKKEPTPSTGAKDTKRQ